MEWICHRPLFRLQPPSQPRRLLSRSILLPSRFLGLGSNPLILTLFFSPTTIPFSPPTQDQDLFIYFMYYAPFRLFLFNAISVLCLVFVRCLSARRGNKRPSKIPLAPANKKLLHPKFATLTNTWNAFHKINRISYWTSAASATGCVEHHEENLVCTAREHVDTGSKYVTWRPYLFFVATHLPAHQTGRTGRTNHGRR